ncbi:unnamed protein product [Pseudo-nitzschia multistriata]|uniref:Uncharacterized protein n=1 Tax=Pseudo-nitzschia multistriata TaxID=183589 RepID=A0A448YU52_9STRA|nr:unnamed protein product [Pseudo-nitzschia multistriata]
MITSWAKNQLRSKQPKAQLSIARWMVLFVGISVGLVCLSFFVSVWSLSTLADCGENALSSVLASSKVSLGRAWRERPRARRTLGDSNDSNNIPYSVLHTVTTRFMVGQATGDPLRSFSATAKARAKKKMPHLLQKTSQYHLTKARAMLFETFCWPTMKFQTWQNFFWIVLVDPGLDANIIAELKTMLGREHFPAENAFLVLTNNTDWASDGVGVENSTSYGVGLQPIAEAFQDGGLEIVTGNTDHLLRALDMMDGTRRVGWEQDKPIMLIETLLDADDGLNNHAVEWIQNTAVAKTKEHWTQKREQLAGGVNRTAALAVRPTLNSTWWLLCGMDHIEWHNRDIYRLTDEQFSSSGLTSGLVGLRQSPLFCTSAGFTRIGITSVISGDSRSGSQPRRSYSHAVFPKEAYSNHALAFYFPPCTPPMASATLSGNYSGCWHREFPERMFVLKSRTITSDSMDHMNPRKSDDYRDVSWLNETAYPLLTNRVEEMWKILGRDFSIDRTSAWETSMYLYENRRLIVRENKNSRCSPGFPCYNEAKKNIFRLEKYWKHGNTWPSRREVRTAEDVKNELAAVTAAAAHETGEVRPDPNPERAAKPKPEIYTSLSVANPKPAAETKRKSKSAKKKVVRLQK